jgi:hypothetical protein
VPEQENSIVTLKKYLGTATRPVSMEEFKDFWNDCTEDEKMEFKQTKLE